jgi:hypothetical protein
LSILLVAGALASLGPALAVGRPGQVFVPVDSDPRLQDLHKESVRFRTFHGAGGGTVLEGGFVVVTAAHLFARDGQSKVLDDNGRIIRESVEVYVPACRRKYQVKYLWLLTRDPERYMHSDFAVLRLRTRVCGEVRGLPYRVVTEDKLDDLNGVEVHVAGWLNPAHPRIDAGRAVVRSAGSSPRLLHVASSGHVERVDIWPEGPVEIAHTAAVDDGMSGGGLIARQGANRILLGVHSSSAPGINYAVGITPVISETIKEALTAE